MILLCNFEDKNTNSTSTRNDFISEKKEQGIFVVELTFENLITALHVVCKTPSLICFLDEFEDYLNRNNLLPIWKHTLDVVNCVGTKTEVEENSVYMCPNTGGQYNHRRAMYFGAYWDKAVNYIFTIDAIIDVEKGTKKQVIRWKNSDVHLENELKRRVNEAINKFRNKEIIRNGILVFLLGERKKVSFKKDSRGGLYGSKIYFKIQSNSLEELAKELDGKGWSAFK